jgi:hypothetical protein
MATKKIRLSQVYVHSGKRYGPGEVEVDEAVAADLDARERKLQGDAQPTARQQAEPADVAPEPAQKAPKARGA